MDPITAALNLGSTITTAIQVSIQRDMAILDALTGDAKTKFAQGLADDREAGWDFWKPLRDMAVKMSQH